MRLSGLTTAGAILALFTPYALPGTSLATPPAESTQETSPSPHEPVSAPRPSYEEQLQRIRQEIDAETVAARRDLADLEGEHGAEHASVAEAAMRLAWVLDRRGEQGEARSLYERALRIRETILGPEHPATAQCLNNLAVLLVGLGEPATARRMYERALRIRETALGADHPDTATSLNNLAALLLATGEVQPARALYERALAIREMTVGDDHPDTAQSRHNLAFLLHRAERDLEHAESLYRQALATRTSALGKGHPDTLRSADLLAELYQEAGDLDRAGSLRERSLAAREDAFGPDHPSTARSAHALATVLHEEGDLGGARRLYERAVSIYEQTLGPLHVDTVNALNNLAFLHEDEHDLPGARALYERVLESCLATHGPEHRRTAISLGNLAIVIEAQGDYATAREYYERCAHTNEIALGPDHPDTATSLGNLAAIMRLLGDAEAALPLQERALRIYEDTLGPHHPETATQIDQLASILQDQADYPTARPLFERALSIRRTVLGPDHPETARSLNSLGLLFRLQGDYERAADLLETALVVTETAFGEDHPETAATLNNLAMVLDAQGHVDRARRLLLRALEIADASFGPDHPETATSLNNLAAVYLRQGEHDRARPLLERALAIRETTLGTDHPWIASILNNLALIHDTARNYDLALPLYERALAIVDATLGEDHPETVTNLSNLAMVCLDRDRPGDALRHARQAMQRMYSHRRTLDGSMTEAERILFARLQRHALLIFLATLDSLPDRDSVEEEAYSTLLGWKAHVFRDLTRSRGSALAELDDDDLARVAEMRAIQARLSREMLRPEGEDHEARQKRLAALRERLTALELEWTRSAGSTRSVRTPDAAEVLQALPEGSVLIDFLVRPHYDPGRRIWSRPRLSAWILDPQAARIRHVDVGDATAIAGATERFLSEMVATRGIAVDSNDNGAAAQLREALWDPIARHIGDTARVFLSPDGVLGTLPFETIQLDGGRYLIEDHAFVYLESAASVVDIRSGREPMQLTSISDSADDDGKAAASLLCVGAVDYRKRGPRVLRSDRADGTVVRGFRNYWTSLPATGEEARTVVELHGDSFDGAPAVTLVGRSATEERVKLELPQHSIVHIATHGFFQPDGLPSMWQSVVADDGKPRLEMREEQKTVIGMMPGLLSGLVLAGANDTPLASRDDGLLTAEEISLLDLSRVRLVVLSACETALGRAESGQGMLGLRRTFRQSGADCVISSLWSIQDDSTRDLMRSFYLRMWQRGEGTLDALRGAQLDMLEQNRIENDGRGLPATWGAFVLDGDWR